MQCEDEGLPRLSQRDRAAFPGLGVEGLSHHPTWFWQKKNPMGGGIVFQGRHFI